MTKEVAAVDIDIVTEAGGWPVRMSSDEERNGAWNRAETREASRRT